MSKSQFITIVILFSILIITNIYLCNYLLQIDQHIFDISYDYQQQSHTINDYFDTANVHLDNLEYYLDN